MPCFSPSTALSNLARPERTPTSSMALMFAIISAMSACSRSDEARESKASGGGPLVVLNAGSLARPLRAALDSFAAREGITVEQENAGSLETARKVTELGRQADLVALADAQIFPQVLMPAHVSWYAVFARNRMVLAYTDRSRGASEIDTTNWRNVITRPGVEVGRADPDLDPAGYRAILSAQLAERFYRERGLALRLLRASPERNVRPKSADLVALLQAGELDYAWEYESVARSAGLRFVHLPSAVDLGDPADSALYASVAVSVRGRTPRDTIVVNGSPISYGLSVPLNAPHRDLAERAAIWLLSAEGRSVLRAAYLDAIDPPHIVGAVPASISAAGR